MGEGSRFHETYRYYAQGVGPETATLPEGWQQRLRKVQTAETDSKVGYCLDPSDLFLSKAFANRDKDREFNMALLRYGYVKPSRVLDLVALMPVDDRAKRDLRARIRRWIRILEERGYDVANE